MRASGERNRNLQNSPTESPSGFFFLADSQKKLKKMQKKSLFSFSSRCQGRALFVVSKRR
tara:strand:- start:1899 stop:2078 length:180 start_codon:yes stop_codon:yes gene_type:complete